MAGLQEYLAAVKKLLALRQAGAPEVEQDALLNEMDELWAALSDEEREEADSFDGE